MRRLILAGLVLVLVLGIAPTAAAEPPTISIDSPDEGATVMGNVTVNGTADDPDIGGSVEDVTVRVDNGTWMATNDTSGLYEDAWSSWNLNWNSTTVSDGNHTITARATDNDGDTANATVNVTVDNAADDGDEQEEPPADVNITITARQSGCPEDRTWCLEVTEGNLTELDPGLRVNATFVNPVGNFGHSLYFADLDDADPDRENTPGSAAFGHVDAISGGEEASTTFTVPSDADRVYVWCDEGQHEGQGMYLEEPAEDQMDGNDTDDGADGGDGDQPPENEDGIPGPGAGLAALAGLGAALVAARRRG